MKDVIGTVNITRHKKVNISSVEEIPYIINEDRSLQAFNVFAENEEEKQNENNSNRQNTKAKRPTIFKNKDLARYKADSVDAGDVERNCRKLSYTKIDESSESMNKTFDISKLHKSIEVNNNEKYEINSEATFDSFFSTDEIRNEERYARRVKTFPSASWKQKDHKNNLSFTSDNVFRFSPGDEIRYSDTKNINVFASILHNHLGSLSSLENDDEKKSVSVSIDYDQVDAIPSNQQEISNAQLHRFQINRSRTPDDRRTSISPRENKNRGSVSPKGVTFNKNDNIDSTDSSSTQERKMSTESEKNDSKNKSYSESFSDVLQNGWRRIASVPRQNSDTKKTPIDFIDFGSCISPDAKKFAGITDKLHTWAYRTNNRKYRYKRHFNISDTFTDPAQKLITQNMKRPLKKSMEPEKLSSSSEEAIHNKGRDWISYNISRDREIIHEYFSQDSDFSLSSNIWYYGELDIALNRITKNGNTTKCSNNEEDVVTGSLIIVLDQYQNLFYSLTYCMGNKLHSGSIPYESGKYSMDFSNPEQPRFSSMKYLIAHLIEQNYLFRVPFTWLLNNLPCTSQVAQPKLETEWCSDGSEIL